MRFLFHDEAGARQLTLKGEAYKYIVKVRRHGVGDSVALRHPEKSGILYTYRLEHSDGRRAELLLVSEESRVIAAARPLHIGWCIIDPKSVEKVLPQLNEMGVGKISFIACDRSQRQFRPDFERFNRILEASMQQCGRSEWMALETADSLESFMAANPQTVVMDFTEEKLGDTAGIDTVLIGCEGGFSEAERALLASCRTLRFDTPLILRSESAAIAVAAKVLL
ncbi:16S rRNA (uracil(1498)-N(3))-methyltransferase [Sulfurimonas sp. HSL-3221]|uniref:16S rRNA (uracil(1498)-N(3))-methyltransferase n=1 Tax=Sulfurimonadaceae TaxID=2771471 RepID=UPI001E4396DE|nr:16S rRNA (uracil(1498)-N(3))-methyltransferase [Sulfurimonas sp. HSL-3221]UFS62319.1 16S rRNA (uracil(1498)-N(3))-methyltransferase [Sulfurimonas sp. HSL-3221]